MGILELLASQLGSSGALNQLGRSVDTDSMKVYKAAQLGLPAILQALNRNTSTSEGAFLLAKALDNHQDDISDIAGFLSKVNKNDGTKILNHIMGLMTQFAPLILGFLGHQNKKQTSMRTESRALHPVLRVS